MTQALGSRVRWGGMIVSVDAKPGETCFEMLEFALRGDGAPDESQAPEGRFVACAPRLYDPAIYRAARSITVVGLLAAPESIVVGDNRSQVPVLKVERLKLWASRPPPVLTFYGEPWPGAWATPWYPFIW